MLDSQEVKKQIIKAGEIAVQELIKVAKEPIIGDDGLAPDPEKMKVAAQAKRIAIEDAFAINARITDEANILDDSDINEAIKDTTSFAEMNALKNK